MTWWSGFLFGLLMGMALGSGWAAMRFKTVPWLRRNFGVQGKPKRFDAGGHVVIKDTDPTPPHGIVRPYDRRSEP